MGLLQKLLSTLGLRESSTGRGRERSGETTVTVEHEPDTASESAVKGTDGATADTGSTGTTSTETASPASSSTAADSTDDAESSVGVPEAEPDEDTGGASDDETTDEESADDETAAAESTAGSGESPDVLNGIGPAYAERLENAGVETVADLAAADAPDLADETGLGEGRISNWIEQAKEY